jgi:hypothetical protein
MTYKRSYCLFILAGLVGALLTGCGSGAQSSSTQSSNTSGSQSDSSSAGFSVSSLVFPSQTVNSTSSALSLTFTNTGNNNVSISGIAISGDFAQTDNCGTTLTVGASCTVKVTFTPTAVGTRSGTLSVTDNVVGGSQQVAISGTGVSAPTVAAAVSVTPTSCTFGSQVLNSSSLPSTITLSNTGNSSLTLMGVSVSGDFAQTNNCGTTLAAGASCAVNVTFTPTSVGSRSGTLSFSDNGPQSPQIASLTGTGVTAGKLVDSPTSVSFGTVTVGQNSSQAVTITNTGGEYATVTAVSTSGAGIGLSGISTPLTLAPNQSATFNVTFDPSSSGSVSGNVYLTNAPPTPSVTIPVSGTGTAAPSHEVILAWSASNSPVTGYNTYRGNVTGGPYTKLTGSPISLTSYTDQEVQAGDTYFYVVTSVGTDMAESAYSNEAKATIPTP